MADSPFNSSVDRRKFVRNAFTSAAGVLTGGVAFLNACERTTDPQVSSPDLRFARPSGGGVRNELHIAQTVSPANLTLKAEATVLDLGGGKLSKVWAFNDSMPGPTIRAASGTQASILFQNRLADQSIVHWHGMLVEHLQDGHPMQAVAGGQNYQYAFAINQRACMNWYHPHPHLMTGKQVNMGLAGAFIVNDPEEAAVGLPTGAQEIPLIIRDTKFDSAGNIQYQAQRGGFEGTTPLINGTRDAKLTVAKAIYRFRIVNGSSARIYRLALGNGAPLILIGNDGGFIPNAPAYQAQIDMAPGERLDVLIDFRTLTAGASVMLRCLSSGWDLLQFVSSGQVVQNGVIPSTLPSVAALSAPVRTRTFSFDGMSRINGKEYGMDRIDFEVPFQQTELWRFNTAGNAPHPVHVHGASFQVVARTGGRAAVQSWERGWKDTVLLGDNETVDVLVRFDAFRGIYLIHCHKLEHEDMGMMSNFEVV